MFKKIYVLFVFAILAVNFAFAGHNELLQKDPPPDVKESRKLSDQGFFQKAEELLNKSIAKNTDDEFIKEYCKWEIERLRRVKKDYSLTKEDLAKELKEAIKDFQPMELEDWITKGYLDTMKIDCVDYFVGSSVENLFFTRQELRSRRIDRQHIIDKTNWGKKMLEHARNVKAAAESTKSPLVLPINVEGEMTLSVKKDKVQIPDGKIVKCWIPVPSVFPQQSEVNIISISPEYKWISQPEAVIRSAYFEDAYKKGKETKFNVKYQYRSFSFYRDIDPAKVTEYNPASEASLYLGEQEPNIVFSQKLRKLSEQILQGEENKAKIAKKLYDWVTENIYYSYAREYSTFICIPQITFDRKHGDCGMEALLFISLCRLNGIAARWQSGWEFMDKSAGMHDWAEIYLEPYGWLPVDPYMGVFAMTGEHELSDKEKNELRDFYFGGLDHFRMVANKAQNQDLYPPKQGFRSDSVDFQRGEMEYDDVNLFFDEYKREMKLTEMLKK